MLIRFRVGNYGSFKEVQELSMTPGRTERHPEHIYEQGGTRILRAAAIYGANASGKSNLIKALRAMRRSITEKESIPTDRYFRPDDKMRSTPSYFEVELAIGDSLFSYGFEYLINEQEVVDEWLYRIYTDRESEIVFQRTGRNMEHTFHGQEKQKLDVYAEDTIEHRDRLFLSVMGKRARPANGNLGVFNDIYDWFLWNLRFINTEYPFTPERLVSDGDFDRLNTIISSFGTGINSIGYTRKEGMDELLPPTLVDDLRRRLSVHMESGSLSVESNHYASIDNYRMSLVDGRVVFDENVYRHNGDTVVYRPDEESDGTRRLFGLLASTFIDDSDATFIMDRLETDLHPMVTYRFVRMFLEEHMSKGSQIIFTSHESSLMDFRLLRRDEIWFLEKDDEGASSLYSLEDFNERNDRRIEKAYREGRYGGIPVFIPAFPN